MAARHDHWNPPGNVVQAKFQQGIAFLVGEQELLGVVGEDADAVHTLIDHTVQHPLLSRQIKGFILVKGCGGDGKDSSEGMGGFSGRHGDWVA